MDFNPNKPALTKNYFWATYIPDRRPNFKMYSQRGHALNSFQYKSKGILYKWIEEEWKEIFRLDESFKKSDNCQLCNASLIREYRTNHVRRYNNGERKWINLDADRLGLIWVCRHCKRSR